MEDDTSNDVEAVVVIDSQVENDSESKSVSYF